MKSDRDAGRFQARGEQIMMMEHLAEKQRWEEEMAREVDGVIGEDQIEDEMIPGKFFLSLDFGSGMLTDSTR